MFIGTGKVLDATGQALSTISGVVFVVFVIYVWHFKKGAAAAYDEQLDKVESLEEKRVTKEQVAVLIGLHREGRDIRTEIGSKKQKTDPKLFVRKWEKKAEACLAEIWPSQVGKFMRTVPRPEPQTNVSWKLVLRREQLQYRLDRLQEIIDLAERHLREQRTT